METIELEPHVLTNRLAVAFYLAGQNGTSECLITITALEAYFWLEPGAGDARILKTFRNGFGRIRAIAERKLLARPAAQVELTVEDFARP
ncbi:DUF1488 family protein [Paraburkholderia sp.]|uniref:DUF1488 family protein n=1 Tax=Paraburkholderia sp. TaxID=1926495 RepID=UPI0039E2D1AF